uniref:Uncharacterized protein n=1 Tax=Ditylum brightwellii TaxID=49249 RepID=A0A7S4RTJ0_9STRA
MKVKLLTFAFYRSPNHAQVEGVKHLRSFLRERALQSGDNGGGDDICVAGSLSEECGAKKKDSCGLCSAYSLECGVDRECIEASTCTESICDNDIANTREPLQCDPSDLSLTILNK